ncbi:MAG: twin-arginine translocation signal domain-containing protein [Nitrospirae bacterium]|nr:MAG: twin-arginine translocation signal domain-containing protein [Nitrospirota bacterium]
MAMINRYRFAVRPGMRKGITTRSPIPTRIVSNEEFLPLPQTPAQAAVERLIEVSAESAGRRLGLTRRDFLKTTSGMAAALLAMNSVFGEFFDVLEVEAVEAAAFAERNGDPFFIFDVQTHYVSAGYDPTGAEATRKGAVTKEALLGLRRRAREASMNPKLSGDRGTLADLAWENFIKEVFLDSETTLGLISTPPGPYPQEAVVPPNEMAHIRDEINRVTGSQRLLAHGLATPQLGQADLEFMELQAVALKVDAWKCYTGSPPKSAEHGWWMDDEKVAYPMLEKAQALGVPRVCVHKGLPLGPVEDYNHPRDLIKAAKDFPNISFLVYHSGFRGAGSLEESFARTGEIPWTSEFCRMKRAEPRISNIYMELGSTFGQLVTTHPAICAHLLGEMIGAFGADHVLWGTDSIWYGTPQWQIEAFRRFQIPESLIDTRGYRPLTREVKAQIFGLNAARVFGVKVGAKRNELPKDYLNRIKMSYLEEGPAPSHRFYGWVAG